MRPAEGISLELVSGCLCVKKESSVGHFVVKTPIDCIPLADGFCAQLLIACNRIDAISQDFDIDDQFAE